MTDEAARYLERAKESDRTAEEAWERIQELSEQAEWDVERMLPEVSGEVDVGECPVCGDRHSVSYIVEPGIKNLRSEMYSVNKVCYEDRDGVFVAYVHGEEM